MELAGRAATQFAPSSDLQNLSTDYFRVAATDEHGEQGPWSETWRFTITKTGTISGKVIELQTGEPIAGAIVQADGETVLTDQEGAFKLAVIPGEHLVRVEAAGFCPCERIEAVRSGEAASECDFTALRQPAVSGLAMFSFPLRRGTHRRSSNCSIRTRCRAFAPPPAALLDRRRHPPCLALTARRHHRGR